MLGFGALLLVFFVFLESRSTAPLVKLSIFRIRSIATANVAMMLVASALFGMFFFVSLYAQDVLHYSPLQAGFAFLPLSLGIVVGAGISQAIIPRLGVRNVSVVGLALATAGVLWMTRAPVHGSYVTDLLISFVPMSIGLGLVFVPLTLLATSGVRQRRCRTRLGPVQQRPAGGWFARSGDPGDALGGPHHDVDQAGGQRHRSHRLGLSRGVPGVSDHDGRRGLAACACFCASGTWRALNSILRQWPPLRERLPRMRKDAQANRERLLEAADRMFREHGVEVSVGEIADAAGVGRGTLFRNFRNKNELIAAVLSERLSEVLAYGRDLLERDPDDAEVTFTFLAGLVAASGGRTGRCSRRPPTSCSPRRSSSAPTSR